MTFFVRGRSFYSNVSRLVDELFNSYLRRPGFVNTLSSKILQRHHRLPKA